jgi:hypothetical protein
VDKAGLLWLAFFFHITAQYGGRLFREEAQNKKDSLV